jgi:hypothetical protein
MTQPTKPRNPGSFSIQDNKIRIQNLNGQSSVLFEDISSITWVNRSMPNMILISIGIALLFCGPLSILTITSSKNSYGNDSPFNGLALLLAIGSIGLIIYGSINKTTWDDVIIETRGGALLSYSVDEGNGRSEVNNIEDAKRKSTII